MNLNEIFRKYKSNDRVFLVEMFENDAENEFSH